MGGVKKAFRKPKQKAPKVQRVAPEVKQESGGYKPSLSQGRKAQGSLLDPMMAKEDEQKDLLG
jgi:hypothetical protein